MTESKYSKYVNKNWITWSVFKEVPCPQFLVSGHQHLDDYPFSMGWSLLTEPFTMIPKSHSHDYDQLICFVGGNNKDIREFGAVVEFGLGEEEEIQVITESTFIWVPKGLLHGPLHIKEVREPIGFIDVVMDPVAGGAGDKKLFK
ncbi:MAG: hypothetical protein JW712_00900 [Dehalococcoidales bacterium]|nr:hypothetical protein [Dehalococcoidales bacterium]